MLSYIPNIPQSEKKRIVVAGSGFAGLKLVRKLIGKGFQIVLLDKNNFHQFQPLLYQVATAGLDFEKIEQYLNIILVGGGPTGVELAGALAEMKKYIFPKDYPELDLSKMRIALYEASPRVLASMSEEASQKALEYLEKLGVEVHLNTAVLNYNGSCLKLADGSTISSRTVIWSAGIKANPIAGLNEKCFGRGKRLIDGRNLAVADLPFGKLKGIFAWVLWSFVHLFTIVGVKNRLLIFLNWSWNYFTYDQSLRLLIKPKMKH
ncbi:MAG: FAD-dependent oxidoreductase [Bacteroidales bacterium]|nr:FAD-dependent oxidoreductase [Bacteroidales bacterium]